MQRQTDDQDRTSGRFTGSNTYREFRDAAGIVWSVRECPIPHAEWTEADEQSDSAGYGVGWLRFECGGDVWWLRLYSKYWVELSEAELVRLRHRARRALDGASPRG